MKILFVVYLMLLSCSLMAGEWESGIVKYKEMVRPYMVEYMGPDFTGKILGPPPITINLPPIPEISVNAKSTEIFKKQENRQVIDKETEQKYNYVFINELFMVTKKIRANRNDLATWLNVMNQGASREGVYRAMVLDDDYARLERLERPLNDATIKFVIGYMNKFLKREIDKRVLEKINFFSLKRIIVEQTLEIVDELLRTNPEYLYDWYAVFSGEMAEKYSFWTGTMRKEKSLLVHRQWAKSVPEQHIKSEIIIKIHKILNNQL